MLLIGYVSDEQYQAVAGAFVSLFCGEREVACAVSSATGAVFADVPAGEYTAAVACKGYGSYRSEKFKVAEGGTPHQFRLLSDGLLGYMRPGWSVAGQVAEFCVHSTEPYRLSLYRCAETQELVKLNGWFDAHGPRAVMQITPDGDYCANGVRWNTTGWGSPHHTQMIGAPECSGLYSVHAETESGRQFSFPWIVAPAKPASRIAVLASCLTWNAYNSFGGRSTYVNATGLPPTPTVNARQDLQRYRGGAYDEWLAPNDSYAWLSFDRPNPGCSIPFGEKASDPIRGRDACHMAGAEWRTLAWLERENFTYDLYAEPQLHTGTLDLDCYDVLILNVHPEYWSRTMFARVYSWIYERRGRVMYLGGNGLNCEVEFMEGTDCSVMRCLAQIPAGGGMAGPVTGANGQTWYAESRMHSTLETRSEASLLGVVCTDAGIMTAAPYTVINSQHPVFHATGLRNGDTFGESSLHERVPGGASGHETDKRSQQSPVGTVLLAKGNNPEAGGAEMVMVDLPGGGRVFSVGSITYPAALLVDDTLSKITRNALQLLLDRTINTPCPE